MKRWSFPLQYSVFYCWLTPSEHNRLAREFTELIDTKADDVRIYAIQESVPAQWLGRPTECRSWAWQVHRRPQ